MSLWNNKQSAPSCFSVGWVLTHSQGHDTKMVPDQLDHLAFLQWSGTAADHCLASPAQLQEVAPQFVLQGPTQRPAICDQNEAAGHGFPISSQGSQTLTTLDFQYEILK